jgi:Ser/Thr protein kinase RdoA (MazF antagonist)
MQNRDLVAIEEFAKKSLVQWFDGSPKIEFVRNVENVVYRVLHSDGVFYLRVTEESHQTKQQILAEIEWMNHLSSHSIELAKPIKTLDGHWLLESDDSKSTYFACLFVGAPGEMLGGSKLKLHWTEKFWKSLGEYIGSMHKATQSFHSTNEKRPTWHNRPHIFERVSHLGKEPRILRALEKGVEWMSQLEASPLTFGMIHSDLHHGNYHVNGSNQLCAFDFDDCQYGYYGYDLMVPYYYFSQTNFVYHSEKDQFKREYLDAYKSVFPLMSDHIEGLEYFKQFRHAEMLCLYRKILGPGVYNSPFKESAEENLSALKKGPWW